MPPEFYISCPECGHNYNAHQKIYDQGEAFLMFCPLCMERFERKDGDITGANFPLTDTKGESSAGR